MSNTLSLTGERFVPECVGEINYEHWHRFALVLELFRQRSVLDVVCGEGYGSAMLAGTAARVVGLDFPGIHFCRENIRFALTRLIRRLRLFDNVEKQIRITGKAIDFVVVLLPHKWNEESLYVLFQNKTTLRSASLK